MIMYIAMYDNGQDYEDNYQCPIGVYSSYEKADSASVAYCKNNTGNYWIRQIALDRDIVS